MSWNLKINRQAQQDLDYFRAYNSVIYRACYDLTKSVSINPYEGVGRPQALPKIADTVWYRRVSLQHRMVYQVFENLIIVSSYRTHFE